MPAGWKEIQHICTTCHGTGKIIPAFSQGESPPAEIDCPICFGEGYLEWGREKI